MNKKSILMTRRTFLKTGTLASLVIVTPAMTLAQIYNMPFLRGYSGSNSVTGANPIAAKPIGSAPIC